MTTRVEFEVPGPPVGKGRPRVCSTGTYTPKKTAEFEAAVRQCWKIFGAKRLPDGKPIRVWIMAEFAVPKSYTKKQKAELPGTPHMKKPDADNVAKAVLDALNGYAFADDSLVVDLHCFKRYSSKARTLIVMEVWDV